MVCGTLACAAAACGGKASNDAAAEGSEAVAEETADGISEGEAEDIQSEIFEKDGEESLSHEEIVAILTPTDAAEINNPHLRRLDSMPGRGCVKIKINPLPGGTLGRTFNDSNYLHLASAARIGVERMTDPASAWRAGSKLRRIRTCEDYYVDSLSHSVPYLVPEARRLLTDIGRAFRDSLKARGGGDYRVKVTSVLRTPKLVKKLRRRNRNSIDSSAHLFGTTFDISYSNFICDKEGGVYRTQEDLKNLLGEVVWAMREKERCYVKYERHQACFHITAR